MSRTIHEYKTVPNFLPVIMAAVYFVAQFFISPNFYLTIPTSIIALYITYRMYLNYGVFYENRLELFVFGKKNILNYSEVEFIQITRARGGLYTSFYILIKIKNRKKLIGYPIHSNDKPILKRLEQNGVKIHYLREMKPENFHNPY